MAKKRKPMILSTGMASLDEIKEALESIRSQGNNDIILLHCNSLYPAPTEIVNLNAINTLSSKFKIPVGFSDHTLGIHISIAAVAKGAKIIEKHITLDRKMKGPDHYFAIEPNEMKQLVQNIRDIEKAEGTGLKERSKAEQEMYEKGRRSIIALVDIKKGTKIIPIDQGGGQENGLRSGTENIPGIVGMGKAAEITTNEMNNLNKRLKKYLNPGILDNFMPFLYRFARLVLISMGLKSLEVVCVVFLFLIVIIIIYFSLI